MTSVTREYDAPESGKDEFCDYFQINTTTATFKESGLHHVEGGWPRDINMHDLEQTVRYRRKIEKDELYIHTMLQLLPVIILPTIMQRKNIR